MEEALRFCGERYPLQDIVLAAQLQLVPFYQGFGFAVTSEPYDDFEVQHVEMRMPERRSLKPVRPRSSAPAEA
jgi:predicted GNAT family N-acyltransferase